MSLMSGKIYSNTGAPSNADGVDGDIYLRLDDMKTTYRKESGAWVAVGSTLGAIPEIISGVGAPSNALGADGQYYRDTSNQNIYYKQGSMWNLVGNLKGASFEAALDQAGIGKDLASYPNLINSGSLNAVVVEGQYAYTEDVTDTPTPNGLVWVKQTYARTYVWQFVEGSNNTLYHRISGDNGATWGSWVEYAKVGGNAGVDFLVSGGTQNNSAVSYAQLSSLLHHNSNWQGLLGSDRFFDIPVATGKVFRVVINYYAGAASNGTITFTNPFSTLLGVWPSPLYNANVNQGDTANTHIKSANINGFSFASGVEFESDDVHHPASLAFYWFAFGLVDL